MYFVVTLTSTDFRWEKYDCRIYVHVESSHLYCTLARSSNWTLCRFPIIWILTINRTEVQFEERLVLCNVESTRFAAQANRAQLFVRSRDSLTRHTSAISASAWRIHSRNLRLSEAMQRKQVQRPHAEGSLRVVRISFFPCFLLLLLLPLLLLPILLLLLLALHLLFSFNFTLWIYQCQTFSITKLTPPLLPWRRKHYQL